MIERKKNKMKYEKTKNSSNKLGLPHQQEKKSAPVKMYLRSTANPGEAEHDENARGRRERSESASPWKDARI
jgi:hypothetical protein